MKKSLSLLSMMLFTITAAAYDFGAESPWSYTATDPETLEGVSRTDVSHTIYYAINPDGKTVTVVEGPETYGFDYVKIPEIVTNPNDNKTYTVKAIGTNAFSCAHVVEIVLGNTIEEIQESAFSNCDVVRVFFPTGLKYVRDYAFSGAYCLQRVWLHDGLLSIGQNAFSTCGGPCSVSWMYCSTSLMKVRLPESVTTISEGAFSGNSSLVSINLPMNLKEIEESLLSGCSSLQEITLPTALEKIHRYAFHNAGLTDIDFPSKLKEIDEYAFYGNNFTELILPSTLQTVKENCFGGCTLLTEVTVNFSMDELADGLFSGCSNLQIATINTNITKVGEKVFTSCTQLINVTLPNTLIEIGNNAFDGCLRLTGITLPDNITIIGDFAFANSGLSRFTFPAKLTYISNGLFCNCQKLTSIEVPSTIKEVRESAFSGCASLKTVSLPESLTSLPNNCFYNCSVLTTINVPTKITCIGEYCFGSCSSLTGITLPSGLKEIGGSCFYDCSKLVSISIPDRVDKLEGYTFYECKSLTNVSLPQDMTSIGGSAFENCEKLKTITLPLNLDYIRDGVFSGCTVLTTVNLPSGRPPQTYYSPVYDNQATLYVPKGAKATYEAEDGWSDFSKIAEKDFNNCYYMVEAQTSFDECGELLVNGESYTDFWNDEYRFKAEKGSNVIVKIVPDERYLKKYILLCNGEDVTNQVVDNVYTIQGIEKNMVVEMGWEEGAPNGYNLVSYTTTNSEGYPRILVDDEEYSYWDNVFKKKTGSDVKITVCPDEDCMEKYSLFVGGVDVTSQVVDDVFTIRNIQVDTNVEAVFEKGTPSGHVIVTVCVPNSDGNIIVNGNYSSNWYDSDDNYLHVVKIGTDVDISLEGYYDSKYVLHVNDVDVTKNIVDGEYILRNIKQDTTLKAWFNGGIATDIGNIKTKDKKTELYNLQGQRVNNPQAGHIYVTKQGNKVIVRSKGK